MAPQVDLSNQRPPQYVFDSTVRKCAPTRRARRPPRKPQTRRHRPSARAAECVAARNTSDKLSAPSEQVTQTSGHHIIIGFRVVPRRCCAIAGDRGPIELEIVVVGKRSGDQVRHQHVVQAGADRPAALPVRQVGENTARGIDRECIYLRYLPSRPLRKQCSGPRHNLPCRRPWRYCLSSMIAAAREPASSGSVWFRSVRLTVPSMPKTQLVHSFCTPK